MSTREAPSEAVPIVINGRHWDPSITYAEDSARTDYITITAFRPLDSEQHEDLLRLGVEIQEQVDTDTYLCRYKPKDLKPVRDKPYIRQADVFRSKFKIVEDLKTTTVAAANGIAIPIAGLASTDTSKGTDICTVDLILHNGLGAIEYVSELSNEAQIDPETIEYSSRKLRMTVDRSRLKLLATHDCVRVIEEVFPKTVNNNYAREILEADIIVNDTSYRGEGQIVTVSDTGFDIGDKENCHPAFKGRILELKPLIRKPKLGNTRPYGVDLTDDPSGHGTHVCGSVLGQNMTSELHTEAPIGGIAQKSKLVMQSMYYVNPITKAREQIRTPLDLTDDLFDPPYNDYNSRIFTNSWGEAWTGAQRSYNDNDAREVDEFVWRTQDAVVLFSAGNDNDRKGVTGKPAIGAQAAAKNCITVGATGSKRKIGSKGGNIETMSSMSSWGPTKEGRIKPDVVAPGVNILSTCTQEPSRQEGLKNSDDPYDPLFEIRNGTSMATPLVAGCAAILREVLAKHGNMTPSAALIKALIINGAVSLPGVPMEAQGFGRVNLKNSVAMVTAAMRGVDRPFSPSGFNEGNPLKQGEKFEFDIEIPSNPCQGTKGDFKVTLVYTDPPQGMLQNNLNLVVLGPDEKKRYGNGFEEDRYDEVNNVEQVVLREIPAGMIKMIVWAQKITAPSGEQPFALAWSLM